MLCAWCSQVAHGLVEFWDSIIDASEERQERIGLGRLLARHGLAEHSSKKGKQSYSSCTYFCLQVDLCLQTS